MTIPWALLGHVASVLAFFDPDPVTKIALGFAADALPDVPAIEGDVEQLKTDAAPVLNAAKTAILALTGEVGSGSPVDPSTVSAAVDASQAVCDFHPSFKMIGRSAVSTPSLA